jgi:hypothetical protein
MTNEQLRMQMLSGIITEGQYKAKLEEKSSLNENFVGMGAINNPFIEREKTGYETAFEHFLGEKYELKEEMDGVEEVSLDEENLNEQETVEQAALKYADGDSWNTLTIEAFKAGAEWQRKMGYSEEVEEPNNY